jgi:hypothetical protein
MLEHLGDTPAGTSWRAQLAKLCFLGITVGDETTAAACVYDHLLTTAQAIPALLEASSSDVRMQLVGLFNSDRTFSAADRDLITVTLLRPLTDDPVDLGGREFMCKAVTDVAAVQTMCAIVKARREKR